MSMFGFTNIGLYLLACCRGCVGLQWRGAPSLADQNCRTASAVGVKLYAPKLSPEIVTDPPAELGALIGIPPLTAGASNVKLFDALVPTTALTVTFVNEAVSVVGALNMQATVVVEDHELVAQTSSTTATAVGVKPYEPKLIPLIVTAESPDTAPLNEL